MSTSTRFIGSIITRQVRKSWKLCMTSSRRAKQGYIVRRRCMRGSSRESWLSRKRMDGHGSSPCRICCIVKRKGRCSRFAKQMVLASYRGAHSLAAVSPAIGARKAIALELTSPERALYQNHRRNRQLRWSGGCKDCTGEEGARSRVCVGMGSIKIRNNGAYYRGDQVAEPGRSCRTAGHQAHRLGNPSS